MFFQIYLVEYIENLVWFLLHFHLFPLIVSYSFFGTEHEEEHQSAGEESSQMGPVVHTHIQKAHGKGCECQQYHGGVVHAGITGTFLPCEDEHGAQKSEDGAGCADGGIMPQKNTAQSAADAGNEIQNHITDFAQQQFCPTAEVKQINAVGSKVHDAAVEEHGGDEAVVLPQSQHCFFADAETLPEKFVLPCHHAVEKQGSTDGKNGESHHGAFSCGIFPEGVFGQFFSGGSHPQQFFNAHKLVRTAVGYRQMSCVHWI